MASDEDLVARSKARDKHAFEHLLQPLIGPALRFAYGMLQDRAGAEDVVQEAALKAWRRLGNLRPGADSGPGSWASSPTSAGLCSDLAGGRSSDGLRFTAQPP